MKASIVPVVSLAALGVASCASQVAPSTVGPSLPTASLVCPAEVRVGSPFELDGSASRDLDGPFADVRLLVQPGEQEVAELTGSFTLAASGIATATLVVTDADGNVAEARCRLMARGAGDDPVGPPGPDDPGGPSEPGQPVDLSGDFAMVAYDRPALEGGALDPARQCAAAPQVALVHLEQSGTRVSMSVRTCVMTLPTVQVFMVGLQHSDVPAAVADAAPVLGPIAWELGRAETGAAFAPPGDALAQPVVLGATLASGSEELPTDAADTRVVDADHDGEPGVSIESTFGPQSIIVRRVIRVLSGVIVSANEIEGAAEGSFRVDSDSSLLSPFAFLVPTGAGLPSTFSMARVDGANGAPDLRGPDGALDCTDVRAAADELLAQVAPPAAPLDCPMF